MASHVEIEPDDGTWFTRQYTTVMNTADVTTVTDTGWSWDHTAPAPDAADDDLPPYPAWPLANPWDRAPKRAKQKPSPAARAAVRHRRKKAAKRHKKVMRAVNAAKRKRGEKAAKH